MFKTYKASAGSGKTTSLVAEYLSICLLDTEQYRHVLAITFTNNATAEMKDRIVQVLNDFAFRTPSDWDGSTSAIHDLMVKLQPGLKGDEALVATRAQELLGKILYDYPNFSISTIDSFFQRIIRAFAFELNISMNFELEVTLDDYYAQTIDVLFNRISDEDPYLKKRITNLIFKQMEDSGRWRVDRKLLDDLKIVYGDELAAVPLDRLSRVENLDQIVRVLVSDLSKQREELVKEYEDAKNYIDRLGLEAKSYWQGINGIYGWFMKFVPEVWKTNSYIEKCASGEKFCVKKEVAGYETIHAEVISRYKKLEPLQRAYVRRHYLLKNVESLSVLFDLKNVMDEIRERDNKFFLSDTNFKIYNEISNENSENSDYLFEKIGNRYAYFFIDEFQDTSRMQWENLVPLLHNVLATGNTKAILFGDVKQAIYRFRNGDAKLFADLTVDLSSSPDGEKEAERRDEQAKEYLRLHPGDVKGSFKESQPLKVNYRSGEHIVAFNNLFFSHLPEYKGFPSEANSLYDEYYRKNERVKKDGAEEEADVLDVVQASDPRKKGQGLVTIRFRNDLMFDGRTPDAEKGEKAPTLDEYRAHYVYECVRDALRRGYHCRDIAILTSGRALGSQLARMLATHPEQSFPVISSDSLLLSSSPEVNIVVSALRLLLDPTDQLSCFTLIHLMLRHQNRETPERMAETTRSIAALKPGDDCSPVLEKMNIRIDREKWLKQPLFTMAHLIIQDFHLEETNAFLISFIDNCLKYTSKQVGELGPFLDWWDSKSESLALSAPDGIDAVTISTIHKSKGLQYPVVILPLTQYGNQRTKDTFWYSTKDADKVPLPFLLLETEGGSCDAEVDGLCTDEKALTGMDNLNKVYVAHTRPKDMLYVITGYRDNGEEGAAPKKNDADAGGKKSNRNNGNYNRMLFSCVTANKSDFIAAEGDECLYYYGDVYWRNPKAGESTEGEVQLSVKQVVPDVSKLHISAFEPSSLHVLGAKGESEAQNIGTAVHDFLAKLRAFPQTDEEVVAMQFPTDVQFPDEVRQALHKIVRNPDILPYFAPGLEVLNEVSIIQNAQATSDGRQIVFRPDRVVCFPDKTVVIDYKTGHPTEKMIYEYEKQVDNYVQLLAAMGFPNVTGKILYL